MLGRSSATHATGATSAATSIAMSAVLRIGKVEPAAGIPFRALVAVGWDPSPVPHHPRHVEQVPRHERGVAIGEVVLRTARAGVQIGRTRASLADPPGVGL